MGEILGIGVTHHPGFLGLDENLAGLLKMTLKSDRVPAKLKDTKNWPPGMQREWGADQGTASAVRHRAEIVQHFRTIRARIEAFKPDFILVWGDDQYEQFREECVPPFNVFIFDEVACQPFLVKSLANPGVNNYWKEPVDKTFRFRGHRAGGAHLVHGLLDRGFDVAYSYRLREGEPLSHSFLNTMLYLDYDRTGFDVPLVPFHVNCYGSTLIRSQGAISHLTSDTGRIDPISPTPKRCFEIGRETARILRDSPYRVALVASSSWSHAFLTEKHAWLWPDVDSDRILYEALRAGDYARFGKLSLDQVVDAGQQELLNWICLAGALDELKYRPDYIDYLESYIFNSNKCMAVFTPSA